MEALQSTAMMMCQGMCRDARGEVQRFDDETPFVAIKVFEVGPDRTVPVEIAKHLEPAAALAIEPAPENRANLAGQLGRNSSMTLATESKQNGRSS